MNAILLLSILTCGTERWAIKTLQDGFRVKDWYQSEVSLLIQGPPPKYSDTNPRLEPEETTVWRVNAFVLGAKLEPDGDYHVVIADPDDVSKTMIAEFPSPDCVDKSIERYALLKARFQFEKLFGRITPKYHKLKTPLSVTLEGVGFFDKCHGQLGRAPNCIELHPVLSIETLPTKEDRK